MWLARNMVQDEFLIERMQPTLLITRGEKWQMRLLGGLSCGLNWGLEWGLSCGLNCGLIGGLIVSLTGTPLIIMIGGEVDSLLEGQLLSLLFSLYFGLLGGLVLGLFLGLLGGLFWGMLLGLTEDLSPIHTVEVLKIDTSRDARKIFFNKLIRGLKWGLIRGLIGGLSWGLLFGGVVGGTSKNLEFLIGGLFWGLLDGLVFGLFWGLLGGLIRGLKWWLVEGVIEGCKLNIQTQAQPNQGILNSGRNILLLAIAIPVAAVAGLLLWGLALVLGWVPSLNNEQVAIIVGIVGTTIGTAMAMLFLQTWRYSGVESYLRHYTLRFVLARSGKIPYLYANFLNYCTERLLLQRVGGRFRFLHRTLQEHFAAMPLEEYGRGIKP